MEDPVFFLLNPWLKVRRAEVAGNFVERLAEALAAIPDELDVALFGLPEQLLDAIGAVLALAERRHELRRDPLKVDVVLPQSVISIDEQCPCCRHGRFFLE